MLPLENTPPELIEWGVATLPLPGQQESGDQYLVKLADDRALVAVVDGLGHGPEAAAAAAVAIDTLDRHAQDSALALLGRCHEELKRTRGVVMSVATFNGLDDTLTWAGVGNVEGVLLRRDATTVPARETILLRRGVVGYKLPSLQALVTPLRRGDVLVFATDGIREDFTENLGSLDAPQRMADRCSAKYCKGTDDALVLVVRYLGRAT